MADLQTVSKVVDEGICNAQQLTQDLDTDLGNAFIQNQNVNSGHASPSAVLFSNDSEDSPPSDRRRSNEKRKSILKKSSSEPAFHKDKVNFDNQKTDTSSNKKCGLVEHRRQSTFVDIVTEITRTPIKEDLHPYGRGHLYRNALDKDQPKLHNDEGRFVVWAVVTIVIIGIAAGIIIMSQMYNSSLRSNRYSLLHENANMTSTATVA